MTAILQPSFSRGEISEALRARVDLASYGNGIAKGENVIVMPEGGLQTRSGFAFLDYTKQFGARVIPFVVSSSVSYGIELGDNYMRFWFDGFLVRSGMTIVEVVTPWTAAQAWELHYTQSADVMYLTHTDFTPKRLSRTSATTFVLEDYNFREGPFRTLNANETLLIASSAKNGVVDLTANFEAFTSGMVGMLVKLELAALGKIKPWVVADRGITAGAMRRSDGKVYRARTLAGGGTWTETGSIRPTHDKGFEWDGPATTRSDGTFTWGVGIEWEYLHSGYGIAKVTQYIAPDHVKALVQVPFPDEVIGGLGATAHTWAFTGDGATKVFSIPAAVEISPTNYTVAIDGVPV